MLMRSRRVPSAPSHEAEGFGPADHFDRDLPEVLGCFVVEGVGGDAGAFPRGGWAGLVAVFEVAAGGAVDKGGGGEQD